MQGWFWGRPNGVLVLKIHQGRVGLKVMSYDLWMSPKIFFQRFVIPHYDLKQSAGKLYNGAFTAEHSICQAIEIHLFHCIVQYITAKFHHRLNGGGPVCQLLWSVLNQEFATELLMIQSWVG